MALRPRIAPQMQQKSRPLVEIFERLLRAKLVLISRKGKLADAIRYALSRRKELTCFIDDGPSELDNNAVDRSIGLNTLYRKNALFAGFDVGAEIGPSAPPWSKPICSTRSIRSRS